MNTWTNHKSMVLSEPIYLFMTKIKYIFFHILLLPLRVLFSSSLYSMHSFVVVGSSDGDEDKGKKWKTNYFWDGEREKQWKMSCNEKYMEKLKKNSPYFYRVSAPVRVWNRVRYHKPKWQEVFVFCFVSLSSNFSFML